MYVAFQLQHLLRMADAHWNLSFGKFFLGEKQLRGKAAILGKRTTLKNETSVPRELAKTSQAVSLASTIHDHLLSTYYTPATFPNTGDVAVNETGKIYYSCKL